MLLEATQVCPEDTYRCKIRVVGETSCPGNSWAQVSIAARVTPRQSRIVDRQGWSREPLEQGIALVICITCKAVGLRCVGAK